ncbi:catecholate siderophore receptor CirA [Cesiribacter andamanensis AMV16]|uniref:Catecholate siderophore receptor CirA n=1 Tax=Cesiribacter andamanensis AMV16 TaxID=1279009 RepID=M7NTC8_9BACT|nr:catecholate siderophore receptor CirA [Cesiribacter andamanensis AMV16]
MLCFVSSTTSWGQFVTVKGQIFDGVSGQSLPGATVYLPQLLQGDVTDASGTFTISNVPAGTYQLRLSFVGYRKQELSLRFRADTLLRLNLMPEQEQLKELVIEASAASNSYNSNLTGITQLTALDIQRSVGILGEQDLIKTLQLKPGVQSGSEGSSGFFVRGGQADQNLVLLDGVPLYNPSHLFGMFSVFNNDMLRDVKLYKGSFPARFGGRLSSVLDIDLKEGDLREVKGAGGTGLISSRLMLEGPILKDKLSWMVSGRRTYFDMITRQINRSMASEPGYQPIPDYYFYDGSAKLFFKPSPHDRISLTLYQGHDRFQFYDDRFSFNFLWGNRAGILKWDRLLTSRLSATFSLSATAYKYRIRNSFETISQTAGSGIEDLNASVDFAWETPANHFITFGTTVTRHAFDVVRMQQEENAQVLTLKSRDTDKVLATQAAVYVEDSWQISRRFGLEGGLRLTGMQAQNNTELGLEPRMSLRWQMVRHLALKAGYNRAYQYVHLVNSSGSSLPTSFWYPSTDQIKPQLATQYAASLEYKLSRKWTVSNELYYRDMESQIDFRDGAEMYGNPDVAEDLVFGKGWAYGNEFYLEKTHGKTTGWIGYTLGWSWRKYDEINGGTPFLAANDRRHDLSVVLRRSLHRRLEISGTWVYGSGALTTLPPGRFYVQGHNGATGKIIPVYTERNNYRMADYHRLDLGLTYKLRPRWGSADINLGVYNLYNRRNAYFMYFERLTPQQNEDIRLVARQVSLFPILPSLSFNYTF